MSMNNRVWRIAIILLIGVAVYMHLIVQNKMIKFEHALLWWYQTKFQVAPHVLSAVNLSIVNSSAVNSTRSFVSLTPCIYKIFHEFDFRLNCPLLTIDMELTPFLWFTTNPLFIAKTGCRIKLNLILKLFPFGLKT